MMAGNGQLSVPPGFRFHPTEEELLYYYLRKKVSYEAIDLDVIREVDLNKLEPWDLKDKCRIGSGPQDEWYFFSHKDKKYPTGTRTNRATTAGFWKATGRDKAIHLSDSKRIGMRKTLVFYTGRAPHGQKTDWIMHEYRLDDDHHNADLQEDGWVVCRVFKKKTHSRGFQAQVGQEAEQLAPMLGGGWAALEPKQNFPAAPYTNEVPAATYWEGSFKHLPQLSSPSPESSSAVNVNPSFLSPAAFSFNSMEMECSQNLLRLTTGGLVLQPERFNGDWSFLDKLLASHPSSSSSSSQFQAAAASAMPPSSSSAHRFPFHYHAYETSDMFKFSK